MDANKRLKLADIGYQVQNICMLCKHSTFPLDDWGTCELHMYEHEKHTDTVRKLSIHKAGSCPQFLADEVQMNQLGAFAELLNSLRSNV